MTAPSISIGQITETIGRVFALMTAMVGAGWVLFKFFIYDSSAVEAFIRLKSGEAEITQRLDEISAGQDARNREAEIARRAAYAERTALANQIETLQSEMATFTRSAAQTAEILDDIAAELKDLRRLPEMRVEPVFNFNEDVAQYQVHGGIDRVSGHVFVGEPAIISFSIQKPISDLPDCGAPSYARIWLRNGSAVPHPIAFEGVQYLTERNYYQNVWKRILIPEDEGIEGPGGVIWYEVGYPDTCPRVPIQKSPEIPVRISDRRGR